jgi:hypothetical protein
MTIAERSAVATRTAGGRRSAQRLRKDPGEGRLGEFLNVQLAQVAGGLGTGLHGHHQPQSAARGSAVGDHTDFLQRRLLTALRWARQVVVFDAFFAGFSRGDDPVVDLRVDAELQLRVDATRAAC